MGAHYVQPTNWASEGVDYYNLIKLKIVRNVLLSFQQGTLSLSLSTCIIKVVFTIKIVLQETPPSASNDDTSSNFLARYQQTNNNSSCETPHALSMDHLLRLSHLGAVIVQN